MSSHQGHFTNAVLFPAVQQMASETAELGRNCHGAGGGGAEVLPQLVLLLLHPGELEPLRGHSHNRSLLLQMVRDSGKEEEASRMLISEG